MNDQKFLQQAIDASKESVQIGGFPVGAVIIRGGDVVAVGLSNGKQLKDPTNHAEIAVIREACQKLGTRDLKDVELYSSLEPCVMCLTACFWASIPNVVYACGKDKVSKQHYEGEHSLRDINAQFRRPIELVHITELEGQALQVITEWEKTL